VCLKLKLIRRGAGLGRIAIGSHCYQCTETVRQPASSDEFLCPTPPYFRGPRFRGPRFRGPRAAAARLADRDRGITFDSWDTDRGQAWRSRVEHYPVDPAAEPDPAKWEVDVAYLVSES
jgi:hypothetical protein